MPGTRLNDTERRLLQSWRTGIDHMGPRLASLRVRGNPGLRGIQELEVRFDYPLSALCGRNGCGKSTVLALAALAFHSPSGHHPRNALGGRSGESSLSYYTFRNFFYRGPGDAPVTGVSIDWQYLGAPPISITKRTEKWMHYERRPTRPVHYLGLLRSVPAIEQAVLRGHFGAESRAARVQLSDRYRAYLAAVMTRAYDGASVLTESKYAVRRVQCGTEYSSFNMGSGEDLLVDLLWLLQEAPRGALLLVEEIEVGLHPEAVHRLAAILLEIVLEKQLQVIVSTHSRYFLDAIPAEARILLQRVADVHEVTYAPTTQFAMGEMSGLRDPEMNLYCEDEFSRKLIEACLPAEHRRRCRVFDVGSASELARQAKFHQRTQPNLKCMVVWDGDVHTRQIAAWWDASGLNRLNWAQLPGNSATEDWVLQVLNQAHGYEKLAVELNSTPRRAREVIGRLRTVPDPHDIPYELAQAENLDRQEAVRLLVRAVSRLPANPLAQMVQDVRAVLSDRDVGVRPQVAG